MRHSLLVEAYRGRSIDIKDNLRHLKNKYNTLNVETPHKRALGERIKKHEKFLEDYERLMKDLC